MFQRLAVAVDLRRPAGGLRDQLLGLVRAPLPGGRRLHRLQHRADGLPHRDHRAEVEVRHKQLLQVGVRSKRAASAGSDGSGLGPKSENAPSKDLKSHTGIYLYVPYYPVYLSAQIKSIPSLARPEKKNKNKKSRARGPDPSLQPIITFLSRTQQLNPVHSGPSRSWLAT